MLLFRSMSPAHIEALEALIVPAQLSHAPQRQQGLVCPFFLTPRGFSLAPQVHWGVSLGGSVWAALLRRHV